MYSTFTPLEILEVHFDCAGSQNLGGRGGACRDCALVVVPCAFSNMVVTFRGRHKGNLVFLWSKIDFGIGAALLRNADFVAGAALWTWR